jgi:hypothetical protein
LYCDGEEEEEEEEEEEDFKKCTRFLPLITKKWFLVQRLSVCVCMSECMDMPLASAGTVGHI